MRAAKAALLYADDVTVDVLDVRWLSGTTSTLVDDRGRWVSLESLVPELFLAKERGALRFWPEEGDLDHQFPDHLWDAIRGSPPWLVLREGFEQQRQAAVEENDPGMWLHTTPEERADDLMHTEVVRQMHIAFAPAVPVLPSLENAERLFLAGMMGSAPQEGVLANELLATLPAFPEAEMDVILDVRERLAGARARFQAAVSRSADALSELHGAELDSALRDLQQQEIRPAVLDVQECLEELDAIPTLLRVGSDETNARIVTGLAIAASSLDINGVIELAASAGSLASLARELRDRRGIRREAEQLPYWYLHSAEELFLN